MSNLQLEILYDRSHGKSNVKNYLNWNRKWHNIIWSDESNFKCTLNDEFDELRLVPIRGNVNGEVYAKFIVNHAIPVIRRLVSDEQGIFQQDVQWNSCDKKLKDGCINSLDKPTNIDDLEEKVIAAWYSIPSQYYHGV
ncbi:15193_t:CDS:2, partial [Cetraspora pellucida]